MNFVALELKIENPEYIRLNLTYMTLPTSYQKVPGILMALSSAIFWGISGTCAQFLFEEKNLDPAWLVTWRLILGGSILILFSLSQERKAAFSVWKKPIHILQILLFGIVGMVAVQFTYFYSISLSNSATATILQYIGPVFVVAFYALKNRTWPILTEYLALILALSGIFLLVTHGSFDLLVISEDALLWGILSALALAFYTIQPVGLLRLFSPAAITGWGMLIGGITFFDFHPTLESFRALGWRNVTRLCLHHFIRNRTFFLLLLKISFHYRSDYSQSTLQRRTPICSFDGSILAKSELFRNRLDRNHPHSFNCRPLDLDQKKPGQPKYSPFKESQIRFGYNFWSP